MTDKGKTKAQFIDEVVALRQQVTDLRAELSRTERAHAEEALQRAAAELAEWKGRYEAAVQATGQVLYDWNSQTDTVLWSGNPEQMLGYALDELPGTLAETMALVHPADRAAFDQEIVRTRTTKSDAQLTYRLRRKDGAYITVEDKGHFFTDRAGTIARMVGFLVDITERKRMEEALRESERRYRTISEMISDYAYAARIEPDGTYTVEWFTETLTQVTGFTPEQGPYAPGTWQMVIYAEDLAIIQKRCQRLMTGQADESEFRILTKSGEVRWVQEYGRPVWDAEYGRVTHLSIAGRDITERKRMEEALRESEERFSKAFHANPAPLSINTSDGHLLEVNAQFLALFGYRRHEVIGRTSLELGLWSNPHDRARLMATLATHGVLRDQEYTFRTKSGERREVVMSMERITLKGEPCILVLGHDITARKRAEEALQQAKEAAEAANQLKDEFLATMSHELRTPLTIVMGYTSMLLEGAFDPLTAKQQEILRRVKRAAFTELELVSALLEVTALDTGYMPLHVHPVPISELVAEVLSETRDLLHGKPQLQLEGQATIHLPPLQTDRAKLKVVLKNLLGNAVKFTESGTITVSAAERDGGVEFSVADTGIGIAPEVRPVLFERFRQGDSTNTRRHGV